MPASTCRKKRNPASISLAWPRLRRVHNADGMLPDVRRERKRNFARIHRVVELRSWRLLRIHAAQGTTARWPVFWLAGVEPWPSWRTAVPQAHRANVWEDGYWMYAGAEAVLPPRAAFQDGSYAKRGSSAASRPRDRPESATSRQLHPPESAAHFSLVFLRRLKYHPRYDLAASREGGREKSVNRFRRRCGVRVRRMTR